MNTQQLYTQQKYNLFREQSECARALSHSPSLLLPHPRLDPRRVPRALFKARLS